MSTKTKIKVLITFVLIVCSMAVGFVCVINMLIFSFSHPDMTSLRCVIENKNVAIIGVCSGVAGFIGLMIGKSLE